MATQMYRLIVYSREAATLRRACIMRRQLEPWQARFLNQQFKRARLADRYVKERCRTNR